MYLAAVFDGPLSLGSDPPVGFLRYRSGVRHFIYGSRVTLSAWKLLNPFGTAPMFCRQDYLGLNWNISAVVKKG